MPVPAGSASRIPMAVPTTVPAQAPTQTQASARAQPPTDNPVSTPIPSEAPWPLFLPEPPAIEADPAPRGLAAGSTAGSTAVEPSLPPAERYTPAATDRRKQEARERVRMLE